LKSFTVGTITVDVSHTAPQVNQGFLTAFIVKSVNMRRFEVKPLIKKEMTDSSIIDIAFQLEGQGILGTDKYVNEDLDASLSVMATIGRAAAFDALVKRGGRITPEQTDEFISDAIESERHEIYLSLLRYKRDILGFDEGGESGSRFEL
ncbi:MAG: hypothetical protein K6B74_09675, partial [Ruminococcus sp.]|nr:hypothetical protein [Ruminococcus sp.]